MLRPGRFDCIIPVGGLDDAGRRTILEYYLSKINAGKVDIDRIVEMTRGFTPADIQYLFQQIASFSFEREVVSKKNYLVTTETFLNMEPKIVPSLSADVLEEFEKDSITYSRI